MFIEALKVSAHRPTFENESQIYKTGRLRYPIAIARTAVGIVCLPVFTIIACIPVGLYYLTKKSYQ